MAQLTDAQRTWLQTLGIGATGNAAKPVKLELNPRQASGVPDPFSPVVSDAPLKKPDLFKMRDPLGLDLAARVAFDDGPIKEAEAKLKKIEDALAGLQRYIANMPGEQLSASGVAQLTKEARKRYPELAGLAQWVRETKSSLPALRGKLPRPQALLETIEAGAKARGVYAIWSIRSGKDLAGLASERLLAAYMAELPSGVSVDIEGGAVKLVAEGAGVTVSVGDGKGEAEVGKAGTKLALKGGDYTIQVANDGWKEFDPQLRAEWKKIEAEASTVLKLRADRDQAKLELEQKKKDGATLTADLTADFDKREAAFNLAWSKLQERVTATAKASEEKISASIAYLKKDKADKDAVKAGLDAEVDLKAMKGRLEAYYKTPSLEAVLEITASAEKVTGKLELTAVKSGVVVTASFEKALDETKAAIEVMAREGKTKVAAELKAKADELTAKLKLVHETKDLKLAAELEKTLTDVRAGIEVAYSKGGTTVKGGANVSSSGEAGGKVQIDIALDKGRSFVSEGDKLSFAANVSTSGYKFEVAFSIGEPVDTGSLRDLFSTADAQIRKLYELAGDKGVRSIEDAKALNEKLQEVMQPVKDAAAKAKTLKKKSEITASFGFSIEGDWPAGGKVAPPRGTLGVTLHF